MSSDTITISRKEYEELPETREVLLDEDLAKRINASSQEFSQGKKSLLKMLSGNSCHEKNVHDSEELKITHNRKIEIPGTVEVK